MTVPTNQQIRQRITQLIKQDDRSANIVQGYYEEALNTIKNNLNAFYVRYAEQTGLTIAQVEQKVSQWDIQQLKQAVNVVNNSLDDNDTDSDIRKEAKKRVKKATVTATISRKELILSLAQLVVIYATVKAHKHAKVRVKLDIKDEMSIREISRVVLEHLPDYEVNLSRKLWNSCDGLNNMISYLVNKNLSGSGLTQADLEKLFPYINSKNIRAGSITNYVKQVNAIAKRVIRTESARAIDEITMDDFRRKKIKLINWVTEPGACTLCETIADAGPYTIDDCPSIPDDTHDNCRCSKEEYIGESF